MFNFKSNLQERAEILFNHPDNEKKEKEKKRKFFDLGKSKFDEDDSDENMSELKEVVKEDKTSKQSFKERRNNRNDKEEQEVLDLMYPSLKGKDKTDVDKLEKSKDKPNVEKSKINETTKSDVNRETLKKLGINENDFEINGNTISRKKKPKEYDVIDNVKYPIHTDNTKVQELHKQAQDKKAKEHKAKREEYLESSKSGRYRIAVDNIDNPVAKMLAGNETGKEAAENLHMSKTDSYMDTDYAKKHKIYNNYKETPEELREYFREKISSQIGEDKLETTRGILIDKDSESSKNLAKALISHEKFLKILQDYGKAMKNNYSVDDSISFEDKNWHNAIGNADIKNMHINKDGDIELYVTDTYDFNDGEMGAVAVGRDRQEKGEITPYFDIYHVIIPKDIKNEVLKNRK